MFLLQLCMWIDAIGINKTYCRSDSCSVIFMILYYFCFLCKCDALMPNIFCTKRKDSRHLRFETCTWTVSNIWWKSQKLSWDFQRKYFVKAKLRKYSNLRLSLTRYMILRHFWLIILKVKQEIVQESLWFWSLDPVSREKYRGRPEMHGNVTHLWRHQHKRVYSRGSRRAWLDSRLPGKKANFNQP